MLIKKLFFLWIIIFIASVSFAQFGSVNYIDTINPGSVVEISFGDFNNDGFKDIVVINNEWPHDKIKIYYNNSGINFSTANLIVPLDTFHILHNLAVADIDSDGWEDILISEEFPDRLVLLKNNSGLFTSQLFAQAIDFPTRLIIHDFDNNGFLDILSLQHLQVLIYFQNSLGFDSGTIIHSGTEFYNIHIDDFNGDGHTDVAVATVKVDILLNDGFGNFTLHSSMGQGITFTLASGDIDKDGDIDIITWEALQGILSYVNDGAGNFSFQDTVLKHTDNFKSLVVHDFDQDNDLDICTTIGQQGNAIWMQNDGTGSFMPYSLIHHEPGELVYELNAADLNNDSSEDIIWGSNKLAYHLNNFPLTIKEEILKYDFSIFPNPAKDIIFLHNNTDEKLIISIYDVFGKKIKPEIIAEKGELSEIKTDLKEFI